MPPLQQPSMSRSSRSSSSQSRSTNVSSGSSSNPTPGQIDQEAPKDSMITRRDGELPALALEEYSFLQQYVMPPDDLDKFLETRGWHIIAIITVVNWILRLIKAILAMTASAKVWMTLEESQDSISHNDWMAPTMTSPYLLNTPISSENIPVLEI
ncbi:hypothetical protein FBU30_004644 [Linnemannia zychae]|nr:hypothetical protein FBU30_004644 [Linnemannia zychae]